MDHLTETMKNVLAKGIAAQQQQQAASVAAQDANAAAMAAFSPGQSYVTEKLYMLLQLYLQNKGWNPSVELLQCFTELKETSMLPSAAYLQMMASRVTLDSQGRLILRENGKIILPFEHFANAVMLKHMNGPHGLHLGVEATVRAVMDSYTIGREQFGMEREFVVEVVQNCPNPACRYYKTQMELTQKTLQHLAAQNPGFLAEASAANLAAAAAAAGVTIPGSNPLSVSTPGVAPPTSNAQQQPLPPTTPTSQQSSSTAFQQQQSTSVSDFLAAAAASSSGGVGSAQQQHLAAVAAAVAAAGQGSGGAVDLTDSKGKGNSVASALAAAVGGGGGGLTVSQQQQLAQVLLQQQQQQQSQRSAVLAAQQQQQHQSSASISLEKISASLDRERERERDREQRSAAAAAVAAVSRHHLQLQQQVAQAQAAQQAAAHHSVGASGGSGKHQQMQFEPSSAAAGLPLMDHKIQEFLRANLESLDGLSSSNKDLLALHNGAWTNTPTTTTTQSTNSQTTTILNLNSNSNQQQGQSQQVNSAAAALSLISGNNNSGSTTGSNSTPSTPNSTTSISSVGLVGGGSLTITPSNPGAIVGGATSIQIGTPSSSSSVGGCSISGVEDKQVVAGSSVTSAGTTAANLAGGGQEKIVRAFGEVMKNMARMKTYVRPSMCKPYGKQSEALQKTLIDTIQLIQSLRSCLPPPHIQVSSWKNEDKHRFDESQLIN